MSNKSRYLLLIFLFFGSVLLNNLHSQNVTIPDSIIVRYFSDKGLVFDYTVKPGNTFYSISKTFKANLIDLYAFNSGLNKTSLAVGAKILIPFDNELLHNENNSKSKFNVYYKVRKKENLFRIAKIYFGIDVLKIKTLNNLKDSPIQPGQILTIGSADYEEFKPHKQADLTEIEDTENKYEPKEKIIVKDSIVKNEKELLEFEKVITESDDIIDKDKDSTEIELEPELIISDSGMAIWDRNSRTKGIFVLNSDAKDNTLMEIFNPLVNRKIYAKVLGSIPPNSYPDNVKLILSPQAASSLGALNTRFFVRIKYKKK